MTVLYKSGAQENLRRAAKDIVLRIVESIMPDRILLFGSVCRNEAGPGSDIDLLIVKDTALTFKQRSLMLYSQIDRDVDLDMLWYTPNELENMRHTSSFVRHALKTGETLYERPRQD